MEEAWFGLAGVLVGVVVALVTSHRSLSVHKGAALSMVVGEQQNRINRFHEILVMDKALARMFYEGVADLAGLRHRSTQELTQLFYLLTELFGHYDTLVVQEREAGIKGAADDGWIQALLDFGKNPLFAFYWAVDRHTYNAEFANTLRKSFDESSYQREHLDRPPIQEFVERIRSGKTDLIASDGGDNVEEFQMDQRLHAILREIESCTASIRSALLIFEKLYALALTVLAGGLALGFIGDNPPRIVLLIAPFGILTLILYGTDVWGELFAQGGYKWWLEEEANEALTSGVFRWESDVSPKVRHKSVSGVALLVVHVVGGLIAVGVAIWAAGEYYGGLWLLVVCVVYSLMFLAICWALHDISTIRERAYRAARDASDAQATTANPSSDGVLG